MMQIASNYTMRKYTSITKQARQKQNNTITNCVGKRNVQVDAQFKTNTTKNKPDSVGIKLGTRTYRLEDATKALDPCRTWR